jgi:hypothetical protein
MGKPQQNRFFTVALALLLAMGQGCDRSQPTPNERVRTEDLPPLPAPLSPLELPRSQSRTAQDLTLAVVGEVRGELEPCGCPTLPFGGFERRDTLLKQLRAQGPGPLFHIDAGDMLIKGFSTRRADNVQRRAKELLRMSLLVGVDAWIPGPSDLMALPIEQMKVVPGPIRVSATWKDAQGQAIFQPSVVLEKMGIRVGLVGISAPPPDDSGVVGHDPVVAAQQAIEMLPSDLDWVIGAGNINDAEASSLMTKVSGFSAFFSTRGEVYADPPEATGLSPVIESPDRGRYLQVIYARLGTAANEPLLLHPDRVEWRARLSSIRRKEEDALKDIGEGRNLALVNTIPLSAELDQVGAVSERLGTYQEIRRQTAAKRAEKVTPHEQAYASSGSCVNCHSEEFARWTLSGHARAWRALLERDATQNPECVACHSTGFGEPGGLGELSAKNIRKFKGVQCEECHGPMKGHPSEPRAKARPVTRETCLRCHDEANSPDFVYERYLPQASCQGGSPSILPSPPDGE